MFYNEWFVYWNNQWCLGVFCFVLNKKLPHKSFSVHPTFPRSRSDKHFQIDIQLASEYRTAVGIRMQSYAGPDHLISGPFEIRTLCPVTSLDRFIKKIAIKNILFMPKRSSLAGKMSGPDFEWWQPSCFYHLKTGQICPVPTIWNPDLLA